MVVFEQWNEQSWSTFNATKSVPWIELSIKLFSHYLVRCFSF